MELKLLPSSLTYLLNYLLTHLLYPSSHSDQVLLIATLLGVKGHVMSVKSQCCKVKLNNFITQGRETLCHQRI